MIPGNNPWGDEFSKQGDHFNPMMGIPMPMEEKPENKSISTLNFIKSFLYRSIDEVNRKICELQKYGLNDEAECFQSIIKERRKETEQINEVIRKKYPDIKDAQDMGRSSEEGSDKPKECPECGEPMNGDTCPECGYTFNS